MRQSKLGEPPQLVHNRLIDSGVREVGRAEQGRMRAHGPKLRLGCEFHTCAEAASAGGHEDQLLGESSWKRLSHFPRPHTVFLGVGIAPPHPCPSRLSVLTDLGFGVWNLAPNFSFLLSVFPRVSGLPISAFCFLLSVFPRVSGQSFCSFLISTSNEVGLPHGSAISGSKNTP